MHSKLVEILETLGIDIGFIEYNGNAKEYIIFDIYNEKYSNFCDDDNLSETYFISINYWFNSLKNIDKYKKIMQLMKDNKFMFDGGKDLKDGQFYCKSMDFIFTNFTKDGDING